MDTQTLLVVLGIILIVGFFIIYKAIEKSAKNNREEESLKVLTEWLKGMQASLDRNTETTQKQLSEASNALNERLDKAATVISGVQKEIGEMSEIGRSMKELQDFLRSPKLRGNIGEQVLKQLLGQFLPKGSFNLQYRFKSGEIVDAAIKTEAGIIPIDSKFPLENFRKMNSSETEAEKNLHQKEFSRDVKKHIDDIANKYILPEEGTIDYALMYVPSEAVFYEIMAESSELSDYSHKRRVLPVSPSTFYAYLRTILISFEGKKIEERAEVIITSLRSIQTESEKFGEALRVLTKHIADTKNTSDLVNNRYSSLSNKITSVSDLPSSKEEKTLPEREDD
ncbi:MAG TPA: DNA recombination protein RmuC [Candidatus Saccharimonadales bacterium]|nr:DNA recombination protein RmuC [Candidatus Saccharimonadales bacterium]